MQSQSWILHCAHATLCQVALDESFCCCTAPFATGARTCIYTSNRHPLRRPLHPLVLQVYKRERDSCNMGLGVHVLALFLIAVPHVLVSAVLTAIIFIPWVNLNSTGGSAMARRVERCCTQKGVPPSEGLACENRACGPRSDASLCTCRCPNLVDAVPWGQDSAVHCRLS